MSAAWTAAISESSGRTSQAPIDDIPSPGYSRSARTGTASARIVPGAGLPGRLTSRQQLGRLGSPGLISRPANESSIPRGPESYEARPPVEAGAEIRVTVPLEQATRHVSDDAPTGRPARR